MRKEGILMKRLLLSVAAAAMFATSAVADYTFVVPQRAGQGTWPHGRRGARDSAVRRARVWRAVAERKERRRAEEEAEEEEEEAEEDDGAE